MFAAQGQLNGFGPGHIAAQNSDVIEVRQSNGTVAYLWSADLWFSAESGLKGDDHQYWEPLGWAEAAVPGLPEPVPVPHRIAAAGQCASPPSHSLLCGARLKRVSGAGGRPTWRDCYELDLAGAADGERCPPEPEPDPGPRAKQPRGGEL
eukprot:COSAG04_NODE_4042_length_2340_cov_7.380952_2_plen_150_part_00